MKFRDRSKYFKYGVTGIVIVLVALAGYFLVSHAGSIGSFFRKVLKILMPFVWGFAIAYILSPLCNKIEGFFNKHCPKRKKMGKPLSILFSLLFALLIVAALLILVIPSLAKSIIQIATALPGQISAAVEKLSEFLENYPNLQAAWDSASAKAVEYISSWLETDLLSTAQTVISSLGTTFASVFVAFKNIFFGILISVYLLASRKKFARQATLVVQGIFPERWVKIIMEEVHYADKMFNGFFVGRIIDSAIIGVICFIFTTICRFESAVLVSVVVGVTNIIPFFGPYIGAIPCALLLLLENPLHCLIFIIFIIVLQIIDGNLIGPHILGQTTGVSSFWVLFSIMLFGGLWGLIGMIIGVPLFAVIYDIVKKLVYKGLEKHGVKKKGTDAAADAADPGSDTDKEEYMNIKKESFGVNRAGCEAHLYTISSKNGMSISVTDFGAALVSVIVPDKDGVLRDVVLGYDDAAGYEKGDLFLGAAVGRNANRIGGAEITVDGKIYRLEKNDGGKNNLHSGSDFYNKRIWETVKVSDNSVTFNLKSPDGDQGYPGNAEISVTYTLTDDNEIKINYEAAADADTIFNLTNHSYFNLEGCADIGSGKVSDVLDHEVIIYADKFTPADASSVPTGEIADVTGTPMDFRKAKKIGEEINSDYIQLAQAKGYDHNWAINGEGFREAAVMYSEKTGIRMHVYTDLPGMQFYTANYVDNAAGKGGMVYPQRCAACFETQYFPDAVHHANFKSPIVKEGGVYKTETVYRFEVYV